MARVKLFSIWRLTHNNTLYSAKVFYKPQWHYEHEGMHKEK